MSALYKFKEIVRVQEAKDLVDVVLSKTQRKTPTEARAASRCSLRGGRAAGLLGENSRRSQALASVSSLKRR